MGKAPHTDVERLGQALIMFSDQRTKAAFAVVGSGAIDRGGERRAALRTRNAFGLSAGTNSCDDPTGLLASALVGRGDHLNECMQHSPRGQSIAQVPLFGCFGTLLKRKEHVRSSGCIAQRVMWLTVDDVEAGTKLSKGRLGNVQNRFPKQTRANKRGPWRPKRPCRTAGEHHRAVEGCVVRNYRFDVLKERRDFRPSSAKGRRVSQRRPAQSMQPREVYFLSGRPNQRAFGGDDDTVFNSSDANGAGTVRPVISGFKVQGHEAVNRQHFLTRVHVFFLSRVL